MKSISRNTYQDLKVWKFREGFLHDSKKGLKTYIMWQKIGKIRFVYAILYYGAREINLCDR